eukprot:4522214-Amphidinium_carterae.1
MEQSRRSRGKRSDAKVQWVIKTWAYSRLLVPPPTSKVPYKSGTFLRSASDHASQEALKQALVCTSPTYLLLDVKLSQYLSHEALSYMIGGKLCA